MQRFQFKAVVWVLRKACGTVAFFLDPAILPGLRDVRRPPPIWIAAYFHPKAGLFMMHSMKAMTWLKIGGGVLVALAAIAAADTRYAEVTGKEPMHGISHAIASGREGCPIAQQQEIAKTGCCKEHFQHELKKESSGCCRK